MYQVHLLSGSRAIQVSLHAINRIRICPGKERYFRSSLVITNLQFHELSKRLEEKGAAESQAGGGSMIQCVGSRNKEFPNCSRFAARPRSRTLSTSKRLNPDAEVYVLHRDVRTYGEMEASLPARQTARGSVFRFNPENLLR